MEKMPDLIEEHVKDLKIVKVQAKGPVRGLGTRHGHILKGSIAFSPDMSQQASETS